jgi:hypothetical protein
MATARKPSFIAAAIKAATQRISSANREAKASFDFDLARRQAAKTILNPNEVSGEYDVTRALMTTLGGEIRPLTIDDMRTFQQTIRRAKDRFKSKFRAGITAQGVIDLSLQEDRDRANKQIHMAVPVQLRGSKVHFLTNAGPNSDVTRHHVLIDLLDFDAVVAASPNEPKKIGKLLANGRLAFDCDCGRHVFWMRFLSTIGGYNAGRNETGFPRIRNPKLHGIACKHVLRVMHVMLKDQSVQAKLASTVLKARGALDRNKPKVERTKVADLRAMAETQRASRRTLQTSDDRKRAAAVRRARSDMKENAVAQAKAKPTANNRQVERHAKALLHLGSITQAQYDQIVRAAK